MSDAAIIVESLLDSEPDDIDPKATLIRMDAEKAERLRLVGASWRYYSYDVWGNAKDGYEINNVFRTQDVIQIPEPALVSDETLFKHLRKIGFLNGKNLRKNLFSSEGTEGTITLDYNGKPQGELRLEDDDSE